MLMLAWSELVTSTSRRRSTESIKAPESSPNAIAGTANASPTPPTAADEPVSTNTCSATAKLVICPPVADSVWPNHNRR
jgi:hypothetical protein